jgi:L-rhamnose isomerase
MPGDAALGKAATAESPGEAGLLRRLVWRDLDHAIALMPQDHRMNAFQAGTRS